MCSKTGRFIPSFSLFVSGLFSWALATTVHADWYSGDPYPMATAWPQYTDNLSDANQVLALTYDNLTWVPGAGGGVVDRVGGHFHAFGPLNVGASYDTAYWEFRTGMSHNVAGTLVASGSGTASYLPTSFNQGGAAVWRTEIDIPDFLLPAGSYWFGMAIGTSSGSPYGAFVASTSGANGIGAPLADDQSIYFQSQNNTVTWNYTDSYTVNSPGGIFTGFDPSYYIREVPEPASSGLVVLASLVLAWRRPTREFYSSQRRRFR